MKRCFCLIAAMVAAARVARAEESPGFPAQFRR